MTAIPYPEHDPAVYLCEDCGEEVDDPGHDLCESCEFARMEEEWDE